MHKAAIQYFLMLQEFLLQEVSYSIIMSFMVDTLRHLVFFLFFIFFCTRLAGFCHILLQMDDPFSLDTLFVLKF